MNIQDWFNLGWTGWISLKSKGLSRVFSSTTVQKHQFFGNPGLIPGSGRSAGEGIGYHSRIPLQYSWAFLVAQLVKNLPAMQETCVRSLGWEDPLENGKATHCNILAWRIPWTIYPWGCKESEMTEWLLVHWNWKPACSIWDRGTHIYLACVRS